MTEEQTGTILAEYMRRVDAGESVDVEAICQSHPEIADALRSYVAGAAMVDGLLRKDTSQADAQHETLKPGAAHATDSELIGQMFGRYKIERQLGEGAMGAVYLAHDTQLDRPVALKIPKVGYGEKEEFLTRFQREAQAAAKLNHPGICSVFDFGEQDQRPYITMAYIDGQPLSRFIGTTQVNQQWIVEVIRQVADALEHAHQGGVVHRDLKAGNVLIDKDGKPVVTDFGLARKVEQNDESRITQEGAILGTPGYMSPEQVEGNQSKIGPATDIYALGVMLFELLTGELPFRGSIHSILAQIARDEPQNPIKLNPDAHPKLCALSLEMMSKEISKRPALMQDVVDRLSDWATEPSPEDLAEQKKQDERQQKLEAGKQKVSDLIKRGQYAQAINLLEKMSGITDADAVGYASWARDELKRVKELPKKVREGIPSLVATAKKLVKKHDYGQAAEMLQQIPRELRTPEIQELTEKAIDLQDEDDLLLADLHECVNRKQYNGIDDNVKRLLQLKPKNKFAQDLWEALNTYSKVPPKQRNYRFDDRGKLLPKGSALSGTVVTALLVALLSFGGMTYALTIYLKSGNETLTVQVDDELLANGDITLTFDGKNHVITGPEFRLTVSPGQYGYEVRQGNSIIRNPQQFTVVSDGRNVLEIGTSDLQHTVKNLALVPGLQLTGEYQQQSPTASHDIVVTLNEPNNGIWHGEFQSLRATQPDGKVTQTGFKFACELSVSSPDKYELRMTAITGNSSGNTIRDTTADWVEVLTWDGQKLSSGPMQLTPSSKTLQDSQKSSTNAAQVGRKKTQTAENSNIDVSRTTPLHNAAQDPFAGKQLKDRWSKNFLGTAFLWIPPGRFRMGSSRDVPLDRHEQPADVEISYGLWVQQMELTQGEWRKLVGHTPWMPFVDKQANDRNAATHMTWDETVDFCQRLTDRDRRLGNIPNDWEYRLPSEAEWEYFCRAGTTSIYSFGDDVRELGKYAWWKENTQDKGDGYAHEVGKLPPNPWGLYDVHGNVFEFCYDSFVEQLPGGRDPVVANPPIAGKIARGGGWAYVGADAHESGSRDHQFARNTRRNRVGMRLVLAPVSEISAVGYGRQKTRPGAPSGPQKLIGANDWYVLPKESARDWRFSKDTLTAVTSRKMSVAYLKETYEEFELSMDIRCTDTGNGGIYLRAAKPHATFQNVFEVDIVGGNDADQPSGGIYLSDEQQSPTRPTGDRDWTHFFGCKAQTNAFRTGEWNSVKIRLVDQLLTVEINDQLTFWRLLDDLTIAFPHFADAVAQRKGYIGLQAFLGTVQYRNIRIQRLR